ncbi:MAG: 2OG-Fe(II) oxygenase [Betaproteobacteria bacterium]|nr:2OG-Fe(II) oxygenase [Betaproteobacteria bacterium]
MSAVKAARVRQPALAATEVIRHRRAFSASECSTIIELADNLEAAKDQFQNYGEVRGASTIWWLPTAKAPKWLTQRLRELMREAATEYAFDISLPMENLKLMAYRRGNRVPWHVDCGGRAFTRKLTLTLLLSSPATFDGGKLTLANYAADLHRDIGDAVIFPSFMAHKVTTVAKGTRHTLIAWAHGQPFR